MMTEYEILLLEKLGTINNNLELLLAGLEFVKLIIAGFFVWKLFSLMYKLFGGIFFGGI